ncbi:MAG: hypothetical protein P8Y63_11890 [Deltaproteobacteria bacterium]|jgi:hypothetical protein
MITKPINIFFELGAYCIVVAILVYLPKIDIAESFVKNWWDTIVVSLFLLSVISITSRSFISHKSERSTISVVVFGFLAGCFIWSLFVFTEAISEGIKFNFFVPLYILSFGVLSSIFALLVSIIVKILLQMFSSSGRRAGKDNPIR